MSTPFKIPKRAVSEPEPLQMTSPLSRLQRPADHFKNFSFRDRPLSESSSHTHRANSFQIGPKTPKPFTNGWRPRRASDRLLTPPSSVSSINVKKQQSLDPDSPPNTAPPPAPRPPPAPLVLGSSAQTSLRPISVHSVDALSSLRAQQHRGSSPAHRKCSPPDRKCPQTQEEETSAWSDLSDVREKQRQKWREFKEKKLSRSHRVHEQNRTKTRTRTTASSEPIVLSSEEEEVEQSDIIRTGQSEHTQVVAPSLTSSSLSSSLTSSLTSSSLSSSLTSSSLSSSLTSSSSLPSSLTSSSSLSSSLSSAPPPSFLQLDFSSFHFGLSRAEANGRLMVTESGITIPLKDPDLSPGSSPGPGLDLGSSVDLCVVASQVRGFGLWDGGVARGGALFSDSTHNPSGPAPSLLFLWITDSQSKLLQTELSQIHETRTGSVCCFVLLVLKEQLSDLDSALVLSVLDSGDYRKSRSEPGSGPLDWSQGLVLVHTCPEPVDSHLLHLLGQKGAAGGAAGGGRSTRSGLRSGAQQIPSRLIQYPAAPSRGRISVSSEDLLCLNEGQFLNDVIIDFYLKYLLLEGVQGAVAHNTHVFSSFFYKQLSKRRAAGEEDLTSVPDGHTRHQRVRTWTRHVDIFNKHFLFVPVNQECHWFLVVVCFPGLEKPQHEDFNPCSEALRRASGLRSHTPPECTLKGCSRNTVVKQTCLLVMDSLKLSYHETVCRLIRDYLQVEWEVRRGSRRLFSSDSVKTFNCKVPQQDNSSDCGLYLLQYAHSFLQNPVVNFDLPVRLETWFPRQRVRTKREEIRNLVLRLHRDQGLNQD